MGWSALLIGALGFIKRILALFENYQKNHEARKNEQLRQKARHLDLLLKSLKARRSAEKQARNDKQNSDYSGNISAAGGVQNHPPADKYQRD